MTTDGHNRRRTDKRIDELEVSVERIVDLLEGQPEIDLSGNLIRRSGGMIRKQSSMSDTLDLIEERTNGGVTVTNKIDPDWSRSQKIAIAGVLSAIFFAALPGFVEFFHWLAELWILS